MQTNQKAAVLGCGSWGTALAHHLTRSGKEVTLWGIEAEVIAELSSTHASSRYFAGMALDPRLRATTDLGAALEGARTVVAAVPSFAMRSVAQQLKGKLVPGSLVVSVAKGLEDGTLKRMSEVLSEELHSEAEVAALSGPSFALEVLKGFPTAVTAAAPRIETAQRAAAFFHFDALRVYSSTDIVGVELGGAIKNVIALAVGVVDGVGMGLNARAALITRGLAEMQRLVVSLGGQPMTVAGLSGLGDLLLTATGDLSRNRRVGLRIGRGEELQAILKDIGQVAEGVETAHKVYELAARTGVNMPIVEEVNKILGGKTSVQESVHTLLSRAQTSETPQS